MEPKGQHDPKDVLLAMYKDANQLMTDKIKALTIENANLKKQLSNSKNVPKSPNSAPSESAQIRDSPLIRDLTDQLQTLEREMSEKDVEILRLRAEADLSSKKIMFLSHYATSMRHESPQSRLVAKRRMSDLSDRERKLFRRVSDECSKLITDKVDKEQSLSKDLRTKFNDECEDIERSNQAMLEKFKTDFLELKQNLFSAIHTTPPDLDT